MAIPNIYGSNPFAQKLWQRELVKATKKVGAPRVPWNFSVQSQQGGNYLSWQAVAGADGYVLDISTSGDFSSDPSNIGSVTTKTLPGNSNITHFDTVPTASGATPAKRYYRVRATAGTVQKPQSVSGKPSAVISSTAIAPNDTTTAPTTSRDNTTTDQTSTGGRGGYRLPGL